MRISAICAMSENRVIGKDNKLPWHLPADLRHFKKITTGNPILMGRKTYESIGKPLPNRSNIVISRDVNFTAPGCIVVNSIETALSAASYSAEVFIIGGAQLYQLMLSRTQKLYLTLIHQHFDGDTFFPELSQTEWREISRETYPEDEINNFAYSFTVWERFKENVG